MFKTFNLLSALLLSSITLATVPAAFANIEPTPDEVIATENAIIEFINSAEMRNLPLNTDALNDQGKVADYLLLPNGDYLVVSMQLAEFLDQPGPLDIQYSPADLASMQTTVVGTNDLIEVGKDQFAASVINRTVDSQLFCSFTNYAGQGFVAATEGTAMVNGLPQQVEFEMAVMPANIALPLISSYFIAVPSEDCQWNNPAAKTGCAPQNCSTEIGIGWLSTTVTGVCQYGTMLWPLDNVKRCDCAL